MKQPKQTREKELETILVLCVALVIIFFVTQHKHYLTASVVLGLIGMFSKYLTSKISRAWLKLGEMIGAVMSRVILSAVFFLFLFPIALLSRLFSKSSSLQLKKSSADSYYFTRNHKYAPKDLDNVW